MDEVETLPSGQEVEADYVYTNPSGTIVNKGRYQGILPEWRIFSSTRKRRLLSGSGIGNEYECGYHGELYKLPKPYAANFDKNNVYFDEASVKIYDKKNRKNRKDMAIKGVSLLKRKA